MCGSSQHCCGSSCQSTQLGVTYARHAAQRVFPHLNCSGRTRICTGMLCGCQAGSRVCVPSWCPLDRIGWLCARPHCSVVLSAMPPYGAAETRPALPTSFTKINANSGTSGKLSPGSKLAAALAYKRQLSQVAPGADEAASCSHDTSGDLSSANSCSTPEQLVGEPRVESAVSEGTEEAAAASPGPQPAAVPKPVRQPMRVSPAASGRVRGAMLAAMEYRKKQAAAALAAGASEAGVAEQDPPFP